MRWNGDGAEERDECDGTATELKRGMSATERRRRRTELKRTEKPPPPLEVLVIGDYKGTTMYPNWMMSKLTYLKNLTLKDCPNVEQLPPLGKLPLLERFYLGNASMIGKVGDEFLGIDIEEEELSESSKNNNNKVIIIFPNLKSLKFEDLKEWEEWSGMGGTIEEEEEKDNSANAFMHDDVAEVDKIEDSNHEGDDGAGFEADEQVVELNIDERDL
uniref:R13L1/DRL21-like LRR repeat region domain-containing protein n=1 Tax=Quercus lobata TaxID=97700 RepID=A0A7N2LVS8_QUELO